MFNPFATRNLSAKICFFSGLAKSKVSPPVKKTKSCG